MEAKASARYVRVGPQKMRLVVNLIRGQLVDRALGILEFTPKSGAKIVAKAVKSAVVNAEHGARVDVDKLYVKRIWVDEGPTQKRFMPRAHGRGTPIFKRSSHVTVVVGERGRGED